MAERPMQMVEPGPGGRTALSIDAAIPAYSLDTAAAQRVSGAIAAMAQQLRLDVRVPDRQGLHQATAIALLALQPWRGQAIAAAEICVDGSSTSDGAYWGLVIIGTGLEGEKLYMGSARGPSAPSLPDADKPWHEGGPS